MAFEIMLEPSMAWKFYKENVVRLQEEMVEVGTNRETDTVVYLTEDNGSLCVIVERKEKEIFREKCVSDPDAEDTLRQAYLKWLPSPDPVVRFKHLWDAEDPEELEEFESIAQEREEELLCGFEDFLTIVAGNDPYYCDAFAELNAEPADVLNKIIEFLAISCGLRVYRPMVVFDDEEEREVCTEYPYEEYTFGEGEL